MADENDSTPPETGEVTRQGIGGIAPNTQSSGSDDSSGDDSPDEGAYAEAADSEDNSVLLGDEGYVGTSPEYQNDAYGKATPLRSEDDDAAEAESTAREAEEDTAVKGQNIGFRGYTTDTVHPSERKNQADEALRNRARIDEEARQEVRNGTDDES